MRHYGHFIGVSLLGTGLQRKTSLPHIKKKRRKKKKKKGSLEDAITVTILVSFFWERHYRKTSPPHMKNKQSNECTVRTLLLKKK